MKNLIIIGAGDFGKEVEWLVEDINRENPTYNILGYRDGNKDKTKITVGNHEVLGEIEYLYELDTTHDVYAVLAMQDVDSRKRCAEILGKFDRWETLVHPSVVISERTKIGKGCVICAGSSISVDSEIGDHCLLNISSTVGHDCIIEDYVSIMSGAVVCGHVKVEGKAYLGTNCTVIPGIRVGRHAVVGAGSVVLRDVKENTTVMGVPAKRVAMG